MLERKVQPACLHSNGCSVMTVQQAICKHYQCTSKACVKALKNLTVSCLQLVGCSGDRGDGMYGSAHASSSTDFHSSACKIQTAHEQFAHVRWSRGCLAGCCSLPSLFARQNHIRQAALGFSNPLRPELARTAEAAVSPSGSAHWKAQSLYDIRLFKSF